MTTLNIKPFDDAAKRRLLAAVANRGKASGLTAAAKALEHLAASHTRVVGTNTVKEMSALLHEKAAALRAAAETEIAELSAAVEASQP